MEKRPQQTQTNLPGCVLSHITQNTARGTRPCKETQPQSPEPHSLTSGHSFRKEPIQKSFQFSRFAVSLKYKYFRKSIREFSYLFPTLVEKIKICDLEGWIWVLQDLKLIQFGRSFGRHFKIICTK